jgi:hypothetical protein
VLEAAAGAAGITAISVLTRDIRSQEASDLEPRREPVELRLLIAEVKKTIV